MAAGEISRHALIFEDSPEDIFRELAMQGAKDAHWEAYASTTVSDALDHFDGTIGALITVLGTNGGNLSPFSALPIINLSNQLGTPRALYSDHPEVEKLRRIDSSDIVVSKTELDQIPRKLSAWFLGLTQTH